jgi:hypothetical protein
LRSSVKNLPGISTNPDTPCQFHLTKFAVIYN